MAGLVMVAAALPQVMLPPMRADLALMPGSAAEDGSPTWLIHDVLRNRYFRLSLETFQALAHWQAGLTADEFIQTCHAHDIPIGHDDLQDLLRFMQINQLVQADDMAGIGRLSRAHQAARQHWLKWLLHHYLFFKIPLFRPDAFLDRAWPWVAWLYRPATLWTVRALGAWGLIGAAQQWDQFVSTFVHFLSWDGALLYALTLVVVKSAHELGHAFTAKRYGCKVGSIGVAFLVMFPVLYTDTTDAWRLRSSRDRLKIVLAGVGTELHLALLATLAWCFLPDGGWKSAAFFVATTSWISSLVVNVSPFMRFDGYFALSDVLRAENLQPRSFALARWHLRETLFGWGEPVPERLPTWRHRLFIVYAYTTWIYRAVLFLGIALLLYHFTFKVLGIILFVVEIAWFILMPVKSEVSQWWMRRGKFQWNRQAVLTAAGLLAALLMVTVPWRSSVSLPAVLLAGEFRTVYAPERGRVLSVDVQPGQRVTQGAGLVRLAQPELEHAAHQTRRELSLVEERISRQVGSERDLQDALILAQQRQELQTRLKSYTDRQERLNIRSPIEGRISHLERIQTGQWLAQNAPILSLRSESGVRVIAMVAAHDLHRLQEGAMATWVSDLPGTQPVALKLERVDDTAIQTLMWPELGSDFGGPIPTRKQQDQLLPQGAWYQAQLVPHRAQDAPTLRQTGRVVVQAKPESVLGRYGRYAVSVWIRESGF